MWAWLTVSEGLVEGGCWVFYATNPLRENKTNDWVGGAFKVVLEEE